MATVLIIDDDQNLRETLSDLVAGEDHTVLQASNGHEAIQILSEEAPDVALCDWRMSPLGGLDVLRAMQQHDAEQRIPVIVLTAYGDAESTVQAMQAGAYDFLVKPIDVDVVLASLNRALEHVVLQRSLERLQRERFRDGRLSIAPSTVANGSEQLVGKSPAWIEAFKRVGQVAQTDLTILLEGETGTGKEVVAKVIHRNSPRVKGPFVAVNCAAIPEELVESELFGHERGAFTGATSQRMGSFEQAESGTLFLDEIGEMPLAVQPKLLRVLQERTYQRVGGTRAAKANVRVIAATNRSLTQEVEHGRFRSDLFYRLNAYHIELPPLRARKADIGLLAEYFLERFASLNRMPTSALDSSALLALEGYSFPGNVRELEQLMNKAAVEAAGRPITEARLQNYLRPPVRQGEADLKSWEELPFHEATARWERYLIERALMLSGGNKSEAARRLSIQRRLLYEKLQRFGI
ncbi:sigma-54-dependent transcriptional regulator [Terriglobus aquaticus]|uniref:Sigma-54-dependent transcriptional regulator n=1 Tax=Terriglobus aquaticus TaxID=940139 RepID=A0ABW9KKW0_9BACT|nr:sigma-54 dependent transcriptional regulator [Terriglobus aquaticus]